MSISATPNLQITVDIKAQLLAHVEELNKAHTYAYPNNYFDEDRAHASLQRIKSVANTLLALTESISIKPIPESHV